MPIINASIILKCLATHTYYAQNYAGIIYLPPLVAAAMTGGLEIKLNI